MSRALFALSLMCASFFAAADVLIIDEVRQIDSMNVPENGLSKAEVESGFGTPQQMHSAVGNPPITRWDYTDYSVYFEYDLVLFTVLKSGQVIEKE